MVLILILTRLRTRVTEMWDGGVRAARVRKSPSRPKAPALPRLWSADAAGRKLLPIISGCLWYFPDALAAVSHVSHVGNQQHNPGQSMHWAQDKSTDHVDCIGRHLAQLGSRPIPTGVPASLETGMAKYAWRASSRWSCREKVPQNPLARSYRSGKCGLLSRPNAAPENDDGKH